MTIQPPGAKTGSLRGNGYNRFHETISEVAKLSGSGRPCNCWAPLGATAVGAMAIGALAIRRLVVRQGRIEKLSIGELTVDRLIVKEQHSI